MTFNEWWEQHPYRYADSAEELKESCKMAWDSAFTECAKARLNVTTISDNVTPEIKLQEAEKIIRNLLYVYQLGKNELTTARIVYQAEQFLKE